MGAGHITTKGVRDRIHQTGDCEAGKATHDHVSKSSTQLREVGQHTQLPAVPGPGGRAEAVSLRVRDQRLLPGSAHQLQHTSLQRPDLGPHCSQQRPVQLPGGATQTWRYKLHAPRRAFLAKYSTQLTT